MPGPWEDTTRTITKTLPGVTEPVMLRKVRHLADIQPAKLHDL